jgi:hypothetical protein
MILHGFQAGSPVVTDTGCCPSAARGATLAPLVLLRGNDMDVIGSALRSLDTAEATYAQTASAGYHRR